MSAQKINPEDPVVDAEIVEEPTPETTEEIIEPPLSKKQKVLKFVKVTAAAGAALGIATAMGAVAGKSTEAIWDRIFNKDEEEGDEILELEVGTPDLPDDVNDAIEVIADYIETTEE